jgi:hypothetical protein
MAEWQNHRGCCQPDPVRDACQVSQVGEGVEHLASVTKSRNPERNVAQPQRLIAQSICELRPGSLMAKVRDAELSVSSVRGWAAVPGEVVIQR